MKKDPVDDILDQWSEERPELDAASLGVVIRVMSLYRTFLRQASSALQPLELELHEYDVLAALRRQGAPYQLSASALATETELSTGAMTNRVDRLEKRGLVRRQADEVDRRGVNVSLTTDGVRTVDQAIALRLDAADVSLRSLSTSERIRLAALLRKVVLTPESSD